MKKKDTILLNLALTISFYFDHFPGAQSESPVSGWGIFMVFHHQLLCGAELFVALGSVRVGANEYGRPQISIDKSVRVIKGLRPSRHPLGTVFRRFHPVHALFNYKAYRDQLGVPAVSEFTDTVQPLCFDQLPIVDKSLARELADKKVGENPGLGSQVILGTPVIQKVDGKLVWVVPLEHSGFFQWLKTWTAPRVISWCRPVMSAT